MTIKDILIYATLTIVFGGSVVVFLLGLYVEVGELWHRWRNR